MKIVKAFLLIFGCIANFLGIMLVSEGMASHKAILAISGIVDNRAIQLLPSSAPYEAKIIWGIFWLFFGYILIIVNSFLKEKTAAPTVSNPFFTPTEPPQPLPQEKGYFIATDGQRKGPFAISKIMKAYEAKEINRDTLVWTEGMANWQPLIDVEDFRKLIPNAPNFPPLPPTV